MSYKDLENARAKRAAKEKATASKGKCGRKGRKNEQEMGALDVEMVDVRIRRGRHQWHGCTRVALKHRVLLTGVA
jgi:hypothetical protein